jgi:hypothetical protein
LRSGSDANDFGRDVTRFVEVQSFHTPAARELLFSWPLKRKVTRPPVADESPRQASQASEVIPIFAKMYECGLAKKCLMQR